MTTVPVIEDLAVTTRINTFTIQLDFSGHPEAAGIFGITRYLDGDPIRMNGTNETTVQSSTLDEGSETFDIIVSFGFVPVITTLEYYIDPNIRTIPNTPVESQVAVINFNGEPKLFLDQNGASVKFTAGQPEMEQGLENFVLIKLFTEPDWPGNLLFRSNTERVGSGFLAATRLPITITNLSIVYQAVLTALNDPIFGEITVDVRNVSGNNRQVRILLKPPAASEMELLLVQNGVSWIYQRLR